MAIKLTNKNNTIGASSEYPFGSIRNESSAGANDGTPIDRNVYSDMHQFFEKLMFENNLTHNNLPDNATNTFQLYEAIRRDIVKRNYGQGTSAGRLLAFDDGDTIVSNQLVSVPTDGIKRLVTVTQKANWGRHSNTSNLSGNHIMRISLGGVNNDIDISPVYINNDVFTTQTTVCQAIFVHDGVTPLSINAVFNCTNDQANIINIRTILLAVPTT